MLIIPALAAYVINPAEEAVDHGLEPVAESIGLTSGPCPDNWKNASSTDEHARIRACERTVDGVKWLVILTPDGEFERGLPLDTPGADWLADKTKVPGWPK